MGASRFKGKPLQLINNTPMVVHIMKQAQKVDIAQVLVATPDEEIKNVVESYGGECVLTSFECETGTDRVAEAVSIIDPKQKYDVVINLQGDLAVFDSELLEATLTGLQRNYEHFDLATACTPITEHENIGNPNVVKAIISFQALMEVQDSITKGDYAKLLYLTRAACPLPFKNTDYSTYQHLGIFTYKRAALAKFVSSKPSTLELTESIELLRALELNMNVLAVVMTNSTLLEVNTPEDLAYINSLSKKNCKD